MKPIKPLILAIVILLSGCSALKCKLEGKLVDVATNVVVTNLQCSNPAAVRNDLAKIVGGLDSCTAETGIIANLVCAPMVNAVIDRVVNKAVPAAWGCSALNAKATLKTALTNACLMIPVKK